MLRWRRPLILIALLLLASAVVNVAVAWGIAAPLIHADSGMVAYASKPMRPFASSAWLVAVPPHWPGSPEAMGSAMSGWGWRQVKQYGSEANGLHPSLSVFEAGFPARCVRRALLCEADASAGRLYDIGWVGRVDALGLGVYFPTKLLPVGFVINTLLYTAILAMPVSVLPIRRHLRARRGRCPKCGYDRAGLADATGGAAPCPECGVIANNRSSSETIRRKP